MICNISVRDVLTASPTHDNHPSPLNDMHVTLHTRPSRFSACNIEKLGMGLETRLLFPCEECNIILIFVQGSSPSKVISIPILLYHQIITLYIHLFPFDFPPKLSHDVIPLDKTLISHPHKHANHKGFAISVYLVMYIQKLTAFFSEWRVDKLYIF